MYFNKMKRWKAASVLVAAGSYATARFQPSEQQFVSSNSVILGRVYPILPTLHQNLGDIKLNPALVSKMADGGEDHTYNIGSTSVTYPVPPPGFDALTASSLELERYGFPTKPDISDTVEYNKWKSFVTSIDIVEPSPSISTAHNSIVSTESYPNHYGYAAVMPGLTPPYYPEQSPISGNFMSNVTAEYNQVGASTTNCSNPAESSWISFGGYSDLSYNRAEGTPLAQVGSEVWPGGGITPFYEYISQTGNDSAAISMNIPDNVGNTMYAYMSYNQGTNQLAFILSNLTIVDSNGNHPTQIVFLNNAYQPYDPANNYYFPYSASASIEAPIMNKWPYYSGARPMVDFGTQDFVQFNIAFWNGQKVVWKNFNSYNDYQLNGYGTADSPSQSQVNISQIGSDGASFWGGWRAC